MCKKGDNTGMGCAGKIRLCWFSFIVCIVKIRGDILRGCMSSSIADRSVCHRIQAAKFQGSLVFSGPSIKEASSDFGNLYEAKPSAVLSPVSVEDIRKLISIANLSPNLTIAARGNGHSLGGQALARNGIVVNMTTLRGVAFHNGDNGSYVDVKGGEFWIDVLRATLKVGLAPRSWTDYISLSVGGTLSNAGISGQSSRYGPQISNILQLEVVTGKGNVVNCSADWKSDLFFGALGGLGQYGIITGARIIIQKAYERASRWRFVYWNFKDFMHDQELLISLPERQTFDYVEGKVVMNSEYGWASLPFSSDITVNASLIPGLAGGVLYAIDAVFYYDPGTDPNQIVGNISSKLRFIKGLQFNVDTSLFDFLNRVQKQEEALRANGLWFAPHQWLNLFIPKSRMLDFDRNVFNAILKNSGNGLILTYPQNKSLWDPRTSAVIPEEDVFYAVSVLRFNKAYPEGSSESEFLKQDHKILEYCKKAGIPAKKYLGRHENQKEWIEHFGEKWKRFSRRKMMFDPKGILAPGQLIFERTS